MLILEAVMNRKAGYPKGKPGKEYITLDPQGQLATGPDWDAGMAEGQREMAEALERDKAREEEARLEFEAAVKGSEWEGI